MRVNIFDLSLAIDQTERLSVGETDWETGETGRGQRREEGGRRREEGERERGDTEEKRERGDTEEEREKREGDALTNRTRTALTKCEVVLRQ